MGQQSATKFRAAALAGVSRQPRTLSTPCHCPTLWRKNVSASPAGPIHAARDRDALQGHGIHHDAGARSGRARGRPTAYPASDRRLGGKRLRRSTRASGAGRRRIIDYARPLHSAATDYVNLIIHLSRESVPARHCWPSNRTALSFPRESGAARLIGAAMQELYAQADHLTMGEAEAAIEGHRRADDRFRARQAGQR